MAQLDLRRSGSVFFKQNPRVHGTLGKTGGSTRKFRKIRVLGVEYSVPVAGTPAPTTTSTTTVGPTTTTTPEPTTTTTTTTPAPTTTTTTTAYMP